MIQVEKYDSIHQVDQPHWDSILDAGDIFHEWQFIRIVEDGKVENSRFRYLLFYIDEKLIATAVLSAFTISLDIFISDATWVRRIKKWRPGFFNISILICGLPASFGQLNLKITEEKYHGAVCKLVADEMKKQAREWKIRFLSVKEFLEHNKDLGSQFLQEGFFLANSIPYMSMKVCWESFSEYMSSLRHSYRRHILRSLQKIKYREPNIIHACDYHKDHPGVVWVLSDPLWMKPQDFYQWYLEVMYRTTSKLETLNLDFFEELCKDNQRYQLLSLVEEGKIISAALLVPKLDTLTFMLVARPTEKDNYDSYFNLVYGIIAYAINNKFSKIGLGQTAYWVKQSVGGIPENQYLYFACTGKIRHALLRLLNTALFPATKLTDAKIFKSKQNATAVIP